MSGSERPVRCALCGSTECGCVLGRDGEGDTPLPTGVHEWYWGNGRPCCVNCGALARCEHQYERNRADTELRAENDRLREALERIAATEASMIYGGEKWVHWREQARRALNA